MKFYDSHLKKQVDFKPTNEGEANIYLCGPTVYDDAHLGHARSAISFDLLRRVLLALGFKVRFVRNYTDIDDKILHKMSATGASLEQITTQYIASFEADMSALNVLEPDFKPRATEYISAIISYIQMLFKNGFAYEIKDDGIYFDSGRDSKYLSLSARKDENKQARVQNNNLKRDEKDFVLWKFDEKYYDSPFGKGRPGWHSECVAMIREIFGKNSKGDYEIDIHAGGADLLFPHHENEAAQCRCAYNKNLSKYWLHNGFVQINNEKMSKSLGNSFFIKDALKHAPGEALRFYLMAAHYRCNFNYSLDDLSAAKKRLDKIYRLKLRLNGAKPDKVNENFKNEILSALSDDLNISSALASVDEMVNNANAALDNDGKNKILKAQISADLAFVAEIFGILQTDENEWFRWGVSAALKAQITQLINERNLAKTAKNYAKADEIRTRLSELGISIMDTPSGVSWQKRLNLLLATKRQDMKKILSIAGLDSSGGAGIGADIKTITAHKMYAMSAVSAITAQNTLGVRAIMQASAQILSEQISACFDDMGVDALKTGMLFNAELVNAVIKTLKKYQAKNIVCDPVMLATSGAKLLQDDAIDALWELFSISDIITPNLSEASFLAKCEIKNLSDMKKTAKALHTRILNKSNGKNCAVLIKGGHLDACDVLFDGKNFNEFKSEKIHTKNTHGTGCTLSSAIACALASGLDLPKSISHAKNFVLNAIKNDINIGKGCGAINHCYNIQAPF